MNVSERAVTGKAARSQAPRSAHGQMAVSPFAFYRGAAAVMAADLVLRVQACGDAHLA